MNWKIVSLESIKGGIMRYLKPLRPFLAWSQLSIPTVYDDSLSYYEVLNKCIFHFNEMLKIMQENYEIIDEAFAKILEECEAAIARCEEAAARAEAAQSAAEKAQAAAEAAQAAAEAAQKLAEAAQAAAEAARDDAVTAQKAAEAAQAAAEAAQAAAEAAQQKAETAQQKAETAQAAAEAAQAKAEDAQEKAESARDAAEAAAEAAQQNAEEAQTAAEAAQSAAERAQEAAQAAQTAAEEIKNALDNYYNKTESDATFVKKAGDTMTGKLVMESGEQPNTSEIYLDGASKRFKTILLSGNQDFNTLTNNGIYCRTGGTGTDTNAPISYTNFILVVLAFDKSNNIIKQLYFTSGTTPTIYVRFIYTSDEGPIYGKWEKIATNAEINNSLSGYLPLTGGTMTGKINVQDEWNDIFTGLSKGNYVTTINENSDLNDVKTNCVNFYTTKVATSEESKNFPSKSSGFLVSLSKVSLNYIRQIYYVTFYNSIYTRIYDSTSNSWSTWEKILFETDIVGNYLPLSGGTMTGNITMSADTKLIGNAETSDFFKLIHITNASDMNKIISSGFYAISSGDSVSNAPEEISAENNAFSCFVFPWQYPDTTGISQLLFSGDGSTVKGVYLRLTNNPEVGWGNWVRLDNVPDTNTVKVYQVKETDHLRFIIYDLGNYYKVEGYTKQELKWNIPKTIESSPVVGNTYIYNTSLDEELTTGIGEQYTMTSDAHITVLPGLEYFRSSGIVSSISLGGKLGILCLDDSFNKFSFEIQIVWPDDNTWSNMSNKYDIILRENSSVGVVILQK